MLDLVERFPVSAPARAQLAEPALWSADLKRWYVGRHDEALAVLARASTPPDLGQVISRDSLLERVLGALRAACEQPDPITRAKLLADLDGRQATGWPSAIAWEALPTSGDLRGDTVATAEELLRYWPRRTTVRVRVQADIDLGRATIPRSASVVVDLAAANHDPSAFCEPNRFDPRRASAAQLSLGPPGDAWPGGEGVRTALGLVLDALPLAG